jgi:hypothetical protein
MEQYKHLKFGDKLVLKSVDDIPEENVIFVEDYVGTGCFIAEAVDGERFDVPYAQIKVVVYEE